MNVWQSCLPGLEESQKRVSHFVAAWQEITIGDDDNLPRLFSLDQFADGILDSRLAVILDKVCFSAHRDGQPCVIDDRLRLLHASQSLSVLILFCQGAMGD